MARGTPAKLIPLQREGVLQCLLLRQCAPKLFGRLNQRLGLAAPNRLRPLRPRTGVELAAQLGVERVIVEPARLGAAELFKLRPLSGKSRIVCSAIEKVSSRLVQKRQLLRLHRFEIHIAALPRQPCEPFAINPAPLRQIFQTDQVGIARERRRACVRGVAISRRTQRQHLPHMLLGRGQKSHKLMSCGAKVANAPRRRQRSNVQ